MTAAPWMGATKRLARHLGAGWTEQPHGPDGYAYSNLLTRTTVIATRADHDDGHDWLHVSIAHPDRMPTWDELKAVKQALIGSDRFAYLVFPPAWQYVNIHDFALHLWARWDGGDGAALPDFVGDYYRETGELSV